MRDITYCSAKECPSTECRIKVTNNHFEPHEIVSMADFSGVCRFYSWEHLGGDEWFCSACGHVITTEGSWERPWQKYCKECGAKMMREDEEMSKVSEMEMAYAESLND